MLEYVIVTVCAADVAPTAVSGNDRVAGEAEMDVWRVIWTLLIVFVSVPVPLNVNDLTI